MKTLLISIGVSEYQCKLWGKLPGARYDAHRVKSFFHLWGIAVESVILLEGKNATRNNILNAIRVEPLFSNVDYDTVIIYYAGHGEINKENVNKPEHILFCYDTSPYDKIQTGIKVNEIIQGIQRCNPLKVFLFIDACFVQITDFPEYVLSGDEGDWEKSSSFRMYLLAVKRPVKGIEAVHLRRFFFRDYLSYNVRMDPVRIWFLLLKRKSIYKNCQSQGDIGLAQVMLGSLDVLRKAIPFFIEEYSYVNRIDSVSQIASTVLMHPDERCICFYGNAKVGKTILALELAHFFPEYIYYSVDIYRTLKEIEADLADFIFQSLKKDSGSSFSLDGGIDAVLKFAHFLKRPITIILDHAERLSTDNLKGLLDKFQGHDIVLIAFSRTPLVILEHKIFNHECPIFSKYEFVCLANQCANTYMDNINSYYGIYKGRPQEFLLMAQNVSRNEIYKRNEKAISYICACNGFAEVGFFCNKFEIPEAEVYQLLNCGLLRKAEDRFVPHESLFDYFKFDKNAFSFNENSTQYWTEQLIRQPNNTFANEIVLKMVLNRGISCLKDHQDWILSLLTGHYASHFNWRALESLFPHIVSGGNARLIVSVATSLAHVAKGIVLTEDKRVQTVLDHETEEYWKIAISEVLFWKGEFDECIEKCNMIIASSKDQYVLHCAYLNKGISYFFLGEWRLSCSTLEKIDIDDDRVMGWKWLILGTIYAIRGIEFTQGISLLLKCIDKLKEINDLIGLGIAYGNLGECYYKRNDFDAALYYLHLADELTIITNDDATRLEVLRNILMVYLAHNHCYDADAEQIAGEMREIMSTVDDKTELMQVYNSLATASAYNYDIEGLKDFTAKARALTEGNQEYELYTYINEIVFFYIDGDHESVAKKRAKFLELALQGDNYFAMNQCENIMNDIQQIWGLNK